MASDDAGRPLPPLPLETKTTILSYCDVQTLGRAAQVSFAFLELVGPILYEDVTVRGFAHLRRLLDGHEADCPLSSDVCAHLSLSQTRSLTFIGSTEDDPSSMLLRTDTCGHPWSRLSSHRPLRLQTLRAKFFHPPGSARGPSSGSTERFLSLFDPKEVLLSSWAGPEAVEDSLFWVLLTGLPWLRVRSLSLHCVHLDGLLMMGTTFEHPPPLPLPPSSLTVRFDLVDIPEAVIRRYRQDLLQSMINATNWLNPHLQVNSIEAIKEFCFRVESEELGRYFEENLRTSLIEQNYTNWETEKKMALFRFEVVDGESGEKEVAGWEDMCET